MTVRAGGFRAVQCLSGSGALSERRASHASGVGSKLRPGTASPSCMLVMDCHGTGWCR